MKGAVLSWGEKYFVILCLVPERADEDIEHKNLDFATT